MSDWTLTERVREAAFDAWQNTSATLSVRERLDAVLVAVGPHIAAQALRDAGPDLPGDMPKYARRDAEDFLRHRADTIEKEAGR